MVTLEALNRIAQTQPNSPLKPSEKSSPLKHRSSIKEMSNSLVQMPPHKTPATECDRMSTNSVLKIVNDEHDLTPVTPFDAG